MKLDLEQLPAKELPKLMLPYQSAWKKDNCGVKLYTKSRRIGITWAEAADATLEAAQSGGQNTFYLGYDRDMARGFIRDCANWAKAYNIIASEIEETEEVFLRGNEEKSVTIFRIHFNSGKRIEALSSTPRNLRSRQGRVVIDEAAFHDDLPALLKAAKAHRVWGGKIHIITTYNGTENAYYELEQEVTSGKLPYSRHFTTFDMALTDGFFKRICLIQSVEWSLEKEAEWRKEIIEEFGEDAEEELFCIPRNSSGSYFPRAIVEKCMSQESPVVNLSLPDIFAARSEESRREFVQDWLETNIKPLLLERLDENLNSFYGMDFGRSGDLSCFIPCQMLPNLVRKVPFSLELRNIPFRQQEQILFWVVDRLPRFMAGAMDARGNGQYLAEVAQQRYGCVEQVMLDNKWYSEWMPRYRAALEDRMVILPASSDLLQDHKQVVVQKGIPKIPDKRVKGSDGKQRHGDGAIAAALMYRASEMDVIPIEYRSLGKRSSFEATYYVEGFFG